MQNSIFFLLLCLLSCSHRRESTRQVAISYGQKVETIDSISFDASYPVFHSTVPDVGFVNDSLRNWVKKRVMFYSTISRDTFTNPIFCNIRCRVFENDNKDTLSFALIERGQDGGAHSFELLWTFNCDLVAGSFIDLKNILSAWNLSMAEAQNQVNQRLKIGANEPSCELRNLAVPLEKFNIEQGKVFIALDQRYLPDNCKSQWVEISDISK